jgi:hypothetical protein
VAQDAIRGEIETAAAASSLKRRREAHQFELAGPRRTPERLIPVD